MGWLAANGNPTALHFLFARNYALKPEPWEAVLKQKDVCLSPQASTQSRGFGETQLHRLQGIGAEKKAPRHELRFRVRLTCSYSQPKIPASVHSVSTCGGSSLALPHPAPFGLGRHG